MECTKRTMIQLLFSTTCWKQQAKAYDSTQERNADRFYFVKQADVMSFYVSKIGLEDFDLSTSGRIPRHPFVSVPFAERRLVAGNSASRFSFRRIFSSGVIALARAFSLWCKGGRIATSCACALGSNRWLRNQSFRHPNENAHDWKKYFLRPLQDPHVEEKSLSRKRTASSIIKEQTTSK